MKSAGQVYRIVPSRGKALRKYALNYERGAGFSSSFFGLEPHTESVAMPERRSGYLRDSPSTHHIRRVPDFWSVTGSPLKKLTCQATMSSVGCGVEVQ